MLRSFLRKLIVLLFALLVTNSTLLGGYALASLSSDGLAQTVFWWLTMASLLLTVVDLVFLVGTLAFVQVSEEQGRQVGIGGRRED